MSIELSAVAPEGMKTPKAESKSPPTKKTMIDKFPIPDSFYASELFCKSLFEYYCDAKTNV